MGRRRPTTNRRDRSVLPEPLDSVGDIGVGCPQAVDIGFAVDIDDVRRTALAGVLILKIVDDADRTHSTAGPSRLRVGDRTHGIGNIVAVTQVIDLAVNVVLDQSVDRRLP